MENRGKGSVSLGRGGSIISAAGNERPGTLAGNGSVLPSQFHVQPVMPAPYRVRGRPRIECGAGFEPESRECWLYSWVAVGGMAGYRPAVGVSATFAGMAVVETVVDRYGCGWDGWIPARRRRICDFRRYGCG